MIKSRLCDLTGIKYPLIQAGMGPFGTNQLCIASANAGVLGLISSSGVTTKDEQPQIFDFFAVLAVQILGRHELSENLSEIPRSHQESQGILALTSWYQLR